jgi:cytochrome c oxidase cbb3-type subunit III
MRSLLLAFLALAGSLAAQTSAVSPFQAEKARALLRTKLPCLGCHELNGEGGRIGPSLTTVADRRDTAYIRAIIEDPQRVVPSSAMPKTLMPAATRDLVVRYLTGNALTGTTPATAAAQSILTHPPSAGTRPSFILYQQWCASCHGQNGGGDGPNAKYLPVPPAIHSSAPRMSARSDDALFDAIAGGGAVMGKSVRMPAFGATLAPAEIRALVAYIRTLCACRGPAWSTDGSKP